MNFFRKPSLSSYAIFSCPGLEESLRDANSILHDSFFQNKFDEAFERCEKWDKVNLMYSQIKCFMRFLYAMFSLTPVSTFWNSDQCPS